MASSSPTGTQCAMYACPHAGQPLSHLMRAAGCACTVAICEGCIRDIVKSNGCFKCPFCSLVSSSFSVAREVTTRDLLRENYQEARKQSKRAHAAGPGLSGRAAAAGAEKEWEIDDIIGVKMFAGVVYYKVLWKVDDRQLFGWFDVDSNCTWEPREDLVENSALLLDGFHKTFNIPFPLLADYDFSFAAPSTRLGANAKTREYRCAHGDCKAEFAEKHSAMKHSYSLKHLKGSRLLLPGKARTTFVCSFCVKSRGFAQKCSLQRHHTDFHVVEIDEAAWKKFGEALEEELEAMDMDAD